MGSYRLSMIRNGKDTLMSYTISTHNGHDVARQHNLRNEKVVSKEVHIDKHGIHKTWLDIKPSEAYKKIFGKAVEDYNAQQVLKGHAERQIADYYKKIKDDKKKHAVYEMIVSIGSYENHPDAKTSRQILKQFCKGWKDRNPNLVMIGAYYHEDEATPHVHIDYVPVATELTRGMKRQNALVKALEEMGYKTIGIHNTAQVQWEKAQNEELERICIEHGLEIVHPIKDKQKHMKINEYRQQKRIEELERKNAELIDKINGLIDYHNELNRTIDALELGASELAHEIVNNEQLISFNEIV